MGENSKIPWTSHTFSPWWGCSPVSAGCDHCYARELDHRYYGKQGHWGEMAPRKTMSESYWHHPYLWNERARKAGHCDRVFVASMADWCDPLAPPEARTRLWQVIRDCRNLDWLLLTKRHREMSGCLPPDWGEGWPHVWLGVTAENQENLIARTVYLQSIPAVVRFVSLEPLLGPIDIAEWLACPGCDGSGHYLESDGSDSGCELRCNGAYPGLNWVIVGAESGPRARPMDEDWVRSLRDQCLAARVPFFYKQARRNGHKVEMPELDGQVWAQFPKVTR